MPWQGTRLQGLAEVKTRSAKTPDERFLHTFTPSLNHQLLCSSYFQLVMGRNRVSNDLDHVVDVPAATKKAKNAPPKPKPIPPFTPLQITNMECGLGKLPQGVPCLPYSIFTLFFGDDIL